LRVLAGAFHEVIGLGFDPGHEARHLGVAQQRFGGVVTAGQLGFAQHSVYLPVTNAVQKHGFASAFGLGHQVVRVALRSRYGAATQRADRVGLRWLGNGPCGHQKAVDATHGA